MTFTAAELNSGSGNFNRVVGGQSFGFSGKDGYFFDNGYDQRVPYHGYLVSSDMGVGPDATSFTIAAPIGYTFDLGGFAYHTAVVDTVTVRVEYANGSFATGTFSASPNGDRTVSTFGGLAAIDDVTKVTVSSQNGTHSADFGTNDYVFDDIRAIAATDTAPPSVSSIAYTGPAAANASVITYRVVFDEAVRNLTADDFSLVATGTANGTISGLAPAGGSGGTTYDVTVTAVAGTGTLRVDLNALTDVTDATGNGDGTNGHVSAYTAGGTHAVDRDTPAQPAASLALDTGSSGADGITNVGIVNVGGLETNATWQYSVNGGATFVPGSGSTFTLASGSYAAGDVQVRQTDQAGNVGPSVSLSAVTVDATAPGAPTALALAAGSDSGASATDGVTAVRTPTVGGHAEAGAIVRLLDLDRGTTLGTTTADGNGDWSLATSSLGDGTYRLVATAQDSAGNTSTSAVPTSVTVDATGPSVASVAVPANGTYGAGQQLEFTVDFDEAVFVDTVTGTPRLGMVLNSGGAVSADYVSGSGSGSLLFRYTVAAGNADPDGIAIGSFAVNGGTIQDVAGNDAVLTLNNVGSTSGVLVDTGAPSVMALTAVTPSGTYAAGSAIDIRVTFSKAVDVAGVPRLALETGTTDRFAEYVSGAGTDTIVFRYDVQPGDVAADLDTVGTSAFDLNGGTIRDTSGNDAALALPAPGAPGSLGANAAIVVDAVAPVLSSATVNGSALVLSFAEALDTASALPGAFAVKANGMPVSVSAVSASGSAATLTLASAVASGAAVTVAYADPTPGDDANAVQDVAGNDFASLAATNVTNTTAAPPSTPSPTPPTPSPSGPTPWPDRLVGTAASETIDGLGGDDTIVGGSGNDTLLGGAGSDQIMATPILGQIAYVYGGTGPNNPDDGADLLTISGRGAASVWGNGGDDVVSYAADGAATIYAGVGADTVEVANDAANIMIGGSGVGDVLTARGDGANTVFGGSSNVDPLDGADRILVVGNGANALFGNGGDDRIEVQGSGANLVYAGVGADEVVINGSGSNTVYGGTGAGDVVTIRGDGNNVVYGGSFNGDAADGADVVRIEGDGANVVYANGGDDLVVIAGSGTNTVFGGYGNDTIVGSSGADHIVGGPGANVMSGGNGADRFVVNAGGVDLVTDFNLLEGDRIETGGQAYTVSQTAEGYAGIAFADGSYIVLQGVVANCVTGDFFA